MPSLTRPPSRRIDVAEAVEQAGGHQIERNLAGGIEIVAAEEEAEAELLVVAEVRV